MILRAIVFLSLLPVIAAPATSAQVPSTDIFVLSIDGAAVTEVRRVTDREGYDNQPQFLPAGKRLVYASMASDGTNIREHDLRSGKDRVVVDTDESLYSPTPVPDADAISVVRDYGDLKQQLWSFPLGEGQPKLLLPDVNPVGYHAWIDGQSLILFVLGEPHTLQRARLGPGAGKILADSPGRALARMPGAAEMTFVDKSGESWWLSAIDAKGNVRRIAETLEGREDYAWAPDGSVWMGDDSRLHRMDPGDGGGFKEVSDLEAKGIHGITRLAFSPDGSRLALVGERTTGTRKPEHP